VVPDGVDGVNFALMPNPTAIAVAYFSAEGDTISWGTEWEQGTLGFIISRTVDGETSIINEGLILPTGDGSHYSITDANPPAAGTQASYNLIEIDTSLVETDYASAKLVHAATPVGGEAQVVQAGADITTGDAESIVIIGLAANAEIVDVTDAANPIALKGEVIETDGSTGRYLSWPAGRTLETR